jgi:Fuc2NAc and GlcNAc transferase
MPLALQRTLTSSTALVAWGAFSFVAVYAGVFVVRRWLEARQVLDIPNQRSSHQSPVPRGGGLAIAVVVLLVIALGMPPEMSPTQTLALINGSVLIAGVSFLDDLRSLSNRLRLLVQLSAAVVSVLAFGPWSRIAITAGTTLTLNTALGATLAILWIAGLTNAYNFMDGIDLIASGQAIAAGLGWAALGSLADSRALSLAGTSIAFSAAAFAVHNRPPARIFMGDVGSAFLGYLLASMTLLGLNRTPLLGTCGILLVWPFVFDTSFTFLRRLIRGEAVFRAHRSHLYQRLVITGMSHAGVSLLYFVLASVGVGCAIAIAAGVTQAPKIAVTTIAISAVGLWLFVLQREKTSSAISPG